MPSGGIECAGEDPRAGVRAEPGRVYDRCVPMGSRSGFLVVAVTFPASSELRLAGSCRGPVASPIRIGWEAQGFEECGAE
eukprot:9378355-Heterocapsa_arctica.AAC.1